MKPAAPRSFHIKRNDVVYVASGEESGKQGKVLQVLRGKGLAVVEGINLVKRHMKKNQKSPEGGIIEKEAPLPMAKLRVYVEKPAPKAS